MTEAELEIHKEVAVMRHEVTSMKSDISEMKESLAEIVTLKTKGMGAIWLAGTILVLVASALTKFFF